jgi:hypothetical protein
MTPIPSQTTAQPTIEQGINSLLHDAKQKVCERYENCEQRIRESPGQSILIAVAAGYFLHRLPVRSLLVSQVRLAASLAPPALFAIGAAKLCEFLHRQVRNDRPAAPRGLINP